VNRNCWVNISTTAGHDVVSSIQLGYSDPALVLAASSCTSFRCYFRCCLPRIRTESLGRTNARSLLSADMPQSLCHGTRRGITGRLTCYELEEIRFDSTVRSDGCRCRELSRDGIFVRVGQNSERGYENADSSSSVLLKTVQERRAWNVPRGRDRFVMT
jgi:hypothetical protein